MKTLKVFESLSYLFNHWVIYLIIELII